MNNFTPIENLFQKYDSRIGGKFQPKKDFYEKVGINSKRIGMLRKGTTRLFFDEAKRLSEFFGIPIEEF